MRRGHLKRARALFAGAWLVWLGALSAPVAALAPAQAPVQVQLDVRLGFAGRAVVEALTPVRVHLRYQGPRRRAQLVVSQETQTPWHGVVRERSLRTVRLGERVNQVYTFLFPLRSALYPLEVLLEDAEEGEVLTSVEVDLRERARPQGERLTLALSEGGFPRELPSGETVYALDIREIPSHWQAYDGVRRLYVGRFDLSYLDPSQREALERWLRAGGELVLLSGENFFLQDVPFLRPWLPIEVEEVRPLEGSDGWIVTGSPRGEVLFAEEGTPYLLARALGRGRVVLATVNPFTTPTPVGAAFWEALAPSPKAQSESFWAVAEDAFSWVELVYPSRFVLGGILVLFVGGVGLLGLIAVRRPRWSAVLPVWAAAITAGLAVYLDRPPYARPLTSVEYGVTRDVGDGLALHQGWYGLYARRGAHPELAMPQGIVRQLLPKERGDHLYDLDYQIGEASSSSSSSSSGALRFELATRQLRRFTWEDVEENLVTVTLTFTSTSTSTSPPGPHPERALEVSAAAATGAGVALRRAWLWWRGEVYDLGPLELEAGSSKRWRLTGERRTRLEELAPEPVVRLWNWAMDASDAPQGRAMWVAFGGWSRQSALGRSPLEDRQVYRLYFHLQRQRIETEETEAG